MTDPGDFTHRVHQYAAQLAQGEVGALGLLFDLTARRLVRLAIAITRHQQDGEDAVQTVLIHLAAQPAHLARAVCPWAYLLRMVRNEALVALRRKQRWESPVNLSDLNTHCPVDELEREESHRAVWAALRCLPPEQAEVIVLKIWEGLTFAEIGKVLDTSPNTAASRYQYAIAKLGRRLLNHQREVPHG
ncbi:MAG: sigma-70 family RNA polymerase sigma factor [Planctomycetes bacterium]|nr:sigma-70 family RNA polymerase sigma factor [Planctomycetota bacterium]